MEEYYGYAPEKFELWDGHLFLPGDCPEIRQKLLVLLLVNMGLVPAVRLVPEDRWREALDRAYSPNQGGQAASGR